jgi:tryptophan synthase beta subunit
MSYLEEYKKKYTPEQLTTDGIPTIETQLEELKQADEIQQKKRSEKEEYIYRREMLQRVKCLALLQMDKSIFINTNDLTIKDRTKLQKIMWEYNDIPHEDIIKEFNEKVGEVLHEDKLDYSKLPLYDV